MQEEAGTQADWATRPEIAVNEAIEAAMSETDPGDSIQALLSHVAESMHADRAYVFEVAQEDLLANSFEYCAPGVTPQIANLQQVPLRTLDCTWMPRFKNNEPVVVRDVEAYAKEDPTVAAMLRAQDIVSLLAIPLALDGRFIGFIGIDNPANGVAQGMDAFLEMISSFTIALLRHRDNVQRLSYLSTHDRVSGAFNTLYLIDRVKRARKRGKALEGDGTPPTVSNTVQGINVIFFNLVQFKEYNRAFGMTEGNRCLHDIADALGEVFGASCVSRFSADHFVVFYAGSDVEAKVEQTHERVLGLRRGFRLWLEAGIAQTEASQKLSQTVDLAKVACDQIVKDGRAYLCWYTGALEDELERKKYLQDHVEQAAREGWLRVYYQPVIRSLTGRIAGVEALSRWMDPVYGNVSPGVFVPALEEKHLSWRLLAFVADRICSDVASRHKRGLAVVPVSLNVSRTDFESCDPFEVITDAVKRYDIPSSLICVEITESVAMGNPEGIERIVKRFRAAGFEVWMDDFGSAYSSLNTLKDFTFGKLKLDMVFLHNFNQRAKDIITSVIEMAKKLGVHTLAEGVETQEQLDFLVDAGCEEIQGYYYSRPLPLDEVVAFAQTHRPETHDERALYDELGLIKLRRNEACGYVLWQDGSLKLLYANKRLRSFSRENNLTDNEDLERLLNRPEGPYAKSYRLAVERVLESGGTEILPFTEHGREYQLMMQIAVRKPSMCVLLVQLRNVPVSFTTMRSERAPREEALASPTVEFRPATVAIEHSTSDALDTLKGLTNIFISLVNLDLRTWEIQPIVIAKATESFLTGKHLRYPDAVKKFLSLSVDESYRDIMKRFTDQATLAERLTSHGTLAIDYLSANMGWCRIFLIPNGTDEKGRIAKALFAVRDVNTEMAETRRLNYDVNHDPLTGAFNRNGLAMVIDMVRGSAHPMAFAIVDIDNFKTFNDTHGHKAGDRMLVRVTQLLIDSFGATDYVTRIGGDEFVIFLTNYIQDQDGSAIQKRIAQVNQVLAEGHLDRKDEASEISLSAGIVVAPNGYRDDLYELADEALYAEKGAGKRGSRVRVASEA